jgi:hypothetical protein
VVRSILDARLNSQGQHAGIAGGRGLCGIYCENILQYTVGCSNKVPEFVAPLHAPQAVARYEVSEVGDGAAKISMGQFRISAKHSRTTS